MPTIAEEEDPEEEDPEESGNSQIPISAAFFQSQCSDNVGSSFGTLFDTAT